jgi:hypothetical protein
MSPKGGKPYLDTHNGWGQSLQACQHLDTKGQTKWDKKTHTRKMLQRRQGTADRGIGYAVCVCVTRMRLRHKV